MVLFNKKRNRMKETLEEFAENSFLANKLENSNAVEKAHYIAGFREGAKWQQERSYSEEDLRDAFQSGFTNGFNINSVTFEEWFEQFKKK